MKPVHYSALRNMARSPLHYKAALDGGRADTPAMQLGRLVHAFVLGSSREPIVVWEGTRRGKDWTAFETEHVGAEIVTTTEAVQARAIAEAVAGHAEARGLLTGTLEEPIRWAIGGRECAGTPDVLGLGYVCDLKTTTNAEPGWFGRHAISMNYHTQLAWYRHGIELATGRQPERAYIVAVETKPPYAVTCFEMTPRALDMGSRTWRLWWERLLVCEENDEWPGYVSGIYPIDAPDETGLWIDGEEIAA